MTEQSWISDITWLTVPEVAERLDLPLSKVRRLIDEKHLTTVRVDGVPQVPESFLLDGAVLSSLRGTLIVLLDAGFSDEEAVQWLVSPEDTIGQTPLGALREGRKSEVRRVARILA